MRKLQHLISMNDLTRSQIERLIVVANAIREGRPARRSLPSPFILGLLFFEESTRTHIGFQVAAYKLGGEVFTLKETKFQKSMSSSESVEDTVRVLQAYADILCVRHYDEKIFSRILPLCKAPVINCGNGRDEHPTQALTDLMAIRNNFGRLDNLIVTVVGDLRHMRTSRMVLGLAKFKKITVRCISPQKLAMPEKYKQLFKKSGNTIEEGTHLDFKNSDVIYMAGFAPKTPVGTFGKLVRKKYQINKKTITKLREDAIILCPLPRIDEIARDIDSTKHAKYFEQSDNGLFMRMAIIKEMLS